MTADRTEWTGIGAAVIFHIVLIGALSLSLAHIADAPEPPAMQVDFVTEDVAMEASAPTPVAQPESAPPPAPTPQTVPEPDQSLPLPPVVREVPIPRAQPTARPQRPSPPRTQPQRPQRREGLGDNFLSELGSNPAPSAPAAPTFSAVAKTNVASLIQRQAQRCANRQPFIGEGANTIRMTVNLKFARTGRLLRAPTVVGSSGDPALRARYGELLEDQVRRIFADCAPFRLPADLYDTPTGGWKDFTFTYRVQ